MAQGLTTYVETDPDRMMVTDGLTTLTRAEFDRRTDQMIHVLRSHGVEEGDVISIMVGNSVEFVVAMMGASLAGVSHVAVNWHLSVDEVTYILDTSESKLVIVDEAHAEVARRAADQAGLSTVLEFGRGLEAELDAAPDEPPAPCLTASAIYYTSGTTGRPKATRMAEMRNGIPVDELIAGVGSAGYGERNYHLTVGPLYHGGPLMQAVRAVMGGGRIHIMRKFDAEEVLRIIDRERITNTLLVPTHCVRLLRLPDEVKRRYDLSSLEQAYHIGAMMPVEVKRAMIEWWGPILTDAYGCSELGMISFITSPEWLERPGSVGRPVPNYSIQIIGEDDTELPVGEVGTIYITAHNDADIVYLGDPDKTAAAHRRPDQFTLNDLGYLDADGYLYLVDRRVDLIISGGVNIYPAEVEAEMLAHDAVEDVGVFGIPHPEWGHEVKAAVQVRAGRQPGPDLEVEILTWLRDRLAGYKVPKSIDFHDQLPRFTNGKLHRRALRDPYWEDAATAGASPGAIR